MYVLKKRKRKKKKREKITKRSRENPCLKL